MSIPYAKLRLLLSGLWAGSLCAIGYLVAPLLFANLPDRNLAGTLAGTMFTAQFWLSLGLGGVLLVLLMQDGWQRQKPQIYLVLFMLVVTTLSHWGLRPEMAQLRAAAGGLPLQGELQARFGFLHGASSILYLLQSLAGLALLWRMR